MSQPETNSSSRGKSRREGGKQSLYKPSRDERDRSGYGSNYRGKNRQSANVDIAPPTILLKTRANETRSLSPVHQVKSSVSSDNLSRNAFKIPARKDDSDNTATVIMTAPVKLLSEDLAFQDSLHEFLTDNPDFLVVGCVGLQWSGKSSVLSHLAASNCRTIVKQTMFSIATSHLQMKGLTGTIGLDAYVTEDRVIWLDCQPLLSAAIAEREIVANYSKDTYKENLPKLESSCVGTSMEVQSLQLLSFLYCICHILIVVQDSLGDPNLIRLLQTAEMLKPNLASEDSVVDHMPHLVTIYNRAQPSDLVPEMLKQTHKFYKMAFKKSRLQISSEQFSDSFKTDDGANFVSLLDWTSANDQWTSYEETIPQLKAKLLALPRHSFGPAGLTEKSWFSFAIKAWEAVRKSTLMMEYARLLQ
ncbi:protein SMG9-like [Daphnia pulex]|uniref:protein SMG9-like n=1 Tax=Daphnia pulex TaxID=6669 RepID=UPI001EE0D0CF|nr:protein SMG9-like [Daphnia pulex]